MRPAQGEYRSVPAEQAERSRGKGGVSGGLQNMFCPLERHSHTGEWPERQRGVALHPFGPVRRGHAHIIVRWHLRRFEVTQVGATITAGSHLERHSYSQHKRRFWNPYLAWARIAQTSWAPTLAS